MEHPIRVLCVFSVLDRGGSESMCMNLYRAIDRSKVQFDFVKHTTEKGAFEDEITALGGRIFAAPRFKGYNILNYRRWWKTHLVSHPEHKIIHGHYFTISKTYFHICKDYNRITIAHAHTDQTGNKLLSCFLKGLENQADYRMACSTSAGEWLYPHKDFITLKNSINTDEFIYNSVISQETKKELGFEKAFVIGTVSHIGDDKNPMGIVEVMKEVCKRKPNAVFLWVGGDYGAKEKLISALKEINLVDHFIFTGVRADVNRLLQAMDAFLLTSTWEGLPVSLIEAQAAGLHCYISETLSREIDITGQCHFLPLNKWNLWAEAILNNNGNRKDMKEKIVAAGYDIHETAAWLQQFYLSISD